MTEETLNLLLKKIHLLETYSYNQGCADESPQDSWTQQAKWQRKVQEAREDLFNFLKQC